MLVKASLPPARSIASGPHPVSAISSVEPAHPKPTSRAMP
jgi:hypothetical protein